MAETAADGPPLLTSPCSSANDQIWVTPSDGHAMHGCPMEEFLSKQGRERSYDKMTLSVIDDRSHGSNPQTNTEASTSSAAAS